MGDVLDVAPRDEGLLAEDAVPDAVRADLGAGACDDQHVVRDDGQHHRHGAVEDRRRAVQQKQTQDHPGEQRGDDKETGLPPPGQPSDDRPRRVVRAGTRVRGW
ncbi:hypothetical protein [Actinomadura meridiana]|uniref:hypothetical protein n=1 Tax=Actinomadura meridiana TaxID=559626 RepID=UPI0031E8ECC1